MKTTREMIKVMEHFANGGEVEFKLKKADDTNWSLSCPNWDWIHYDYRIKEPRIVIEKWIYQDEDGDYAVIESSNAAKFSTYKKIKLIETYEVEL